MFNWAGPVRFESHDGSTVVTFSQRMGEWQSTQDLQIGIEPIHGAHYGHDPWGRAPAPVNSAEERWRALVPNADVDMVRSTIHRIGKGRLWIKLHEGSERWAWARLNAMPEIALGISGVPYVPLVLPFTRLSDWYAAEASTASRTGNGTLTIDTDGTVETRNITVTLTAHSAGGWSNPSIVNTSSAEQVSIKRVAAAGEMLRLNVLGFRLERSTDNGSSWQDDTQNLMLGNTQVSPLSLMPGGNVINVSGVPNGAVELSWFDSWR